MATNTFSHFFTDSTGTHTSAHFFIDSTGTITCSHLSTYSIGIAKDLPCIAAPILHEVFSS